MARLRVVHSAVSDAVRFLATKELGRVTFVPLVPPLPVQGVQEARLLEKAKACVEAQPEGDVVPGYGQTVPLLDEELADGGQVARLL